MGIVMTTILFDTHILRLGCDAMEILEGNLIVLFGKEVPDIIADICFVHSSNALLAAPKPGDTIEIDERTYRIDMVGDLVAQNLSAMGHCTLNFGVNQDGEVLPGTIYMAEPQAPVIGVGSHIRIISELELPL